MSSKKTSRCDIKRLVCLLVLIGFCTVMTLLFFIDLFIPKVFPSPKSTVQLQASLSKSAYNTKGVRQKDFKTTYSPSTMSIKDIMHPETSTRSVNIKHIHYYNKPGFIFPKVFDKCEYKCKFTSGSKGNLYRKSDAVIFHGPGIGKKTTPPVKKNGQIWVLHSKEPPAYYGNVFTKWKNLFNWTMNYRRDADILAINGVVVKRKKTVNKLNTTLFSSKSNSMAWFVSNCRTPGKREQFVKLLSKTGQKIDVYGGCGRFKCRRKKENACMDKLRKMYKFYLSFENSLCYDYITEKSFKIYEFLVDAIPITRGYNNQYSVYLPPGSYIDTSQFRTIKELSTYIARVASNKTLFESFFKWKPNYESYWPFPVEFCELCRRVHHAQHYKRIYRDLGIWKNLIGYKKICDSPMDVK